MRIAIALVLCIACGDDDAEEPVTPAPQEQPTPANEPTEAASEETDEESAEQNRRRGQTYRQALGEGRRLERAGDHTAAIAAFRRAIEADPSDGRARSELGWAAFNGEDHDLAQQVLDEAIRRFERETTRTNRERRTFASALYNRGRVAEARSATENAARYYRRSLALRPNETVEERLRGLGTVSEEAPEATTQTASEAIGAPTLEALGDELGRRHCAAIAADLEGETCRAEHRVLQREPSDPPTVELAVFVTESETMAFGMEQRGWVAMKVGERWFGFDGSTYAMASGVGGTHSDIEVKSIERVQLIAGGPSEVRFDLAAAHFDSDMGVNAEETTVDTRAIFCGIERGRARCWGSLPVAQSYERVVSYDPAEIEDPEERAELERETETGLPIRERWEVSLTFVAPDKVRIAATDGEPPPALIGEHSLGALPVVR